MSKIKMSAKRINVCVCVGVYSRTWQYLYTTVYTQTHIALKVLYTFY